MKVPPVEAIYERAALGVCVGKIRVGRFAGGGFVFGAFGFCAGAGWRCGGTFAEFCCGEDAGWRFV
jgi:hypothetical protein